MEKLTYTAPLGERIQQFVRAAARAGLLRAEDRLLTGLMLRRHLAKQVAWLKSLQLVEGGPAGRHIESLLEHGVAALG